MTPSPGKNIQNSASLPPWTRTAGLITIVLILGFTAGYLVSQYRQRLSAAPMPTPSLAATRLQPTIAPATSAPTAAPTAVQSTAPAATTFTFRLDNRGSVRMDVYINGSIWGTVSPRSTVQAVGRANQTVTVRWCPATTTSACKSRTFTLNTPDMLIEIGELTP